MSVEQVTPIEVWPSGDSITAIIVDQEPDDLAESNGIVFAEGLDDLDYYTMAAIRLPEDRQAWLWKYKRAPLIDPEKVPSGGTEIRVDMKEDVKKVTGEVLGILGLTENNIVWQHSQSSSQ